MTTPPKARRFRVRPVAAPPPAAAQPPGPDPDTLFAPAPDDDGFGGLRFVRASESVAPATEAEIAAVRAEGLTARQLRLARRVAQRHAISADTDEAVVVLLRKAGIDPFQRDALMDLIEGSAENPLVLRNEAPVPKLPEAPAARPALDEADRARAIIDMQRDIVRRRRRNFAMLMVRLAFFVFLPAAAAGLYFFRLATPFYATHSEFLIQQAEAQGPSGLGSLFRGTQFATSQDAIAVQSYLQSRDAMLRLDREHGFKAHFTQPFIDPLQRLEPGSTNEEAYKVFRRNVKIAYDPTEGIIKMEVSAADPATSEVFSTALLQFAEEQVDQLTQRVREDQMRGARDSYGEAETRAAEAEQRVLDLQQKLGVLDPAAESTVVMSQVAELEAELRRKQLELGQLLDNLKPNQARVDGVRGDITRLEGQIADLRASMTADTPSDLSLAQISGQLRIAETELQTRQMMLSQALQQLETARIEANRQVRYLSLSVAPIAPDEATYPRAFEDTALAFMVFAGIYLMLSLTASILREQVTA